MADFSFFSDSDEDKAVEAILSQAKDQIVLEQVAQINCSGFTDSALPTHLETRFQKLKSFPLSNPKSAKDSSSSFRSVSMNPKPCNLSLGSEKSAKKRGLKPCNLSPESDSDAKSVKKKGLSSSESMKYESFVSSKKTPGGKMANESNSESDSGVNSVGKNEPIHSKFVEDDIFLPVKKNPERKTQKSLDSSTESDSPPRKNGCFWCSPKKTPKKKSGKENNFLGVNLDDDLLADLEVFSVEGQKRLSKKAMKEEERINREAEKIVKWAKQVSARMDISGIEDELSDDDDHDHFK